MPFAGTIPELILCLDNAWSKSMHCEQSGPSARDGQASPALSGSWIGWAVSFTYTKLHLFERADSSINESQQYPLSTQTGLQSGGQFKVFLPCRPQSAETQLRRRSSQLYLDGRYHLYPYRPGLALPRHCKGFMLGESGCLYLLRPYWCPSGSTSPGDFAAKSPRMTLFSTPTEAY